MTELYTPGEIIQCENRTTWTSGVKDYGQG